MTIHYRQTRRKTAPIYSFSDWQAGRSWPSDFDAIDARANGWTDAQIHAFYRAPGSTGARSEDDDGTLVTLADLFPYNPWRRAPYGYWAESGGGYVIFDKDYHPIARKKADGSVEIVAPDTWIDFQDEHWFYGEPGTLPQDNSEVADRIRELIKRLGIRDEIVRRMKLGKLPRATPPRWLRRESAAMSIKLGGLSGDNGRWQGVPFPLSAADYGGCLPPLAPFMGDGLRERGSVEAWEQAVLPLHTIDLSTVPIDDVPDRKWIVPNLIPDRNVTDLSGDGGLGKSLLALQLGIAITTKRDWLGTLPAPGAVLYVSCEDDRDEIMRRRNAVLAGMGLKPKDLQGFHLLDLSSADTTELVATGKGGKLERTSLYAQIERTIADIRRKHPADEARACTIIDTRADMFGGNEINRGEVRKFIRDLRSLCSKHDMAILLLSHPSASGMSSGSGQSGSTAWGNSVRSRLYLTARQAEADAELDPDLRVLSSKKANYGPRGAEIVLRWSSGMFRAEDHSMAGTDKKTQERYHEQVFLALLDKRNRQNFIANASSGPNFAPKRFAEMERGITSRQFKAAMQRLLDVGEIENLPYNSKGKGRSYLVLTDTGMRRINPHF